MIDADYRYFGGKAAAGVWEWICVQLTNHTHYAEPFAGKGSVFRHKLPALKSWLIDSDPEVVDWWNRQLDRAPINGRGHRQNQRCRPRHVAVLEGDGIRFVELAAEWKLPELLVYADPPYLLETRKSNARYKHELTFAQHERLLCAMLRLKGPAFISGYRSHLYETALKKWDVSTRRVITRGGTPAIECLWKNPIARDAAQSIGLEYWELADDYRAREMISRKVKRWTTKFSALDERERRAILFGLLEAEHEAKRLKPRRPHRQN